MHLHEILQLKQLQVSSGIQWIHFLDENRGYYMAARGYEFYLRVLKVSLTSERSERVRDTFSTRYFHEILSSISII